MILIVDLCHKKNSLSHEEFVRPILRIVEKHGRHRTEHYSELTPKDLEHASKIILCGTALKDDEFRRHVKKFNWLIRFDKPVLGICAGMQVLGLVYGSEAVGCKELGMWKIMTKKSNRLFSGVFEAYEVHKTAINPSSEFEILAKSARCVQAIKHKEKEFYGVMFHPEVRNPEIIERFLKL